MKKLTIFASILLPLLSYGEDPAEGHSFHGEVFNEGPRQAAVLIPGCGEVHFPVTTKTDEAQAFFDQGVGQLHGFWYFEAERSFRQVAAIDPDCAMAYWGMAMANFKNDSRGKGFIEEAVKRKESASEREQEWVNALAAYYKDTKLDLKKRLRDYVRALEKIVYTYPDDIEARAFLMFQIYYNDGKDLKITSHYAANLVAEQILALAPYHPANHFQIHLWDKETPERAVEAAERCGPATPAIAHMWHMPGHIYSRLHRYADAAWQQEASARVDHSHMIRFQIIPDKIHNFSHNNEWCIRNFNNLGQLHRSVELARNMISLPRLATFTKKYDDSTYDPKSSSWQYGRQRLRDTYVRFEQWKELIQESESGLLVPDDKSITNIDHHRFVGVAYYETGDSAKGREHLEALQELLTKEKEKRDKAMADAEKKARDGGKAEEEITKAKEAAEKNFKSKIENLENPVRELEVYDALFSASPRSEDAIKLLPNLKNLAKSRHASLWNRAGNVDNAVKVAGEAVKAGDNEVIPLVTQIRILHGNGRIDEAKSAFEKLRDVAAHADTDLPQFSALAPIAKELGFPETWQHTASLTPVSPARPSLDELGPFRWSPPSAKEFSLPDSAGKEITLTSYRGKPVLLIFFLGRGCSHCMEQLQEFTPAFDSYKEAGIDILAISTDTPDGLSQTFQNSDSGNNPFPFPLVSDASLNTFKAYRAYDDFESMPLHGTYLIDGEGKIRWQDISFEPFSHPDWLLEECQRLLAKGENS